jgi:hypothetical protein
MNMKKQSSHFSLKLIDGLARFFFWFLASVSAIFFIFVVINILGLTPDSVNVGLDLPAKFRVAEEGSFTFGNHTSVVTVKEATGTIMFEDSPRVFSIILSLSILPVLGALLYMLWLFKGFTKNVKLGNAFDPINIKHFKQIAYIIAGTWVYLQMAITIYNYYVIPNIAFEGLEFSYTHGSNGGLLLFSLFVWVLSHILEKGAEIEEDNRFTV